MKIKEFLIEAIEKGEKSDKEKSDNKNVTPPKNNDKENIKKPSCNFSIGGLYMEKCYKNDKEVGKEV